jgi:chromosome partitioning protein
MINGKKTKKQQTIAFHSYKGGTGKTTLISNLAAYYAKNGLKVCLLDFDLYAPSLIYYFQKTPKYYLNDLLNGEADANDVLVDLSTELNLNGKLLVGFSNPGKEEINDIEIKHEIKWQLTALRRFLSAKNQIFEEHEIDYLFLDTSPGIRYWSINTLASSDILFLVMKNSDMDVEGTKRMASEIYDSLAKYGSKYFIIMNKVPGASPTEIPNTDEKSFEADLEKTLGTKIVGSVPCYCDIQFSRHEFLFAIKKPDHPFSNRLITLAENLTRLG